MGGLRAPANVLTLAAGNSRERSDEGAMSEGDDKPPDNVIPFVHAIQGTIAEELRKMYAELVREKLPDDISALMKQFAELSNKGSEPGK
jgi:hypothetical protein